MASFSYAATATLSYGAVVSVMDELAANGVTRIAIVSSGRRSPASPDPTPSSPAAPDLTPKP